MQMVLWKYRRFILANALADLRHRFSGSVAGYLWNVFVPLAQLTVFAVIFSVLMGNRMDDEGPSGTFSFIVYLCSGLLAWNAFAETLLRSASSLVGNSGYLKKLPLPEQIFVAQEATGGFLTASISIALFCVFSALIAHWGPFWEWLQALPLLILFLGFAYGLGLILACLNVFFRDVQPFMNVTVLLWFWLTPVVYMERIFHDPKAPHPIVVRVFHLNPAYHFIEGFHQSLLHRQWVPLSSWATYIAITLGFNLVAALVLRRFRSEIRDVL
ncbi:MAG: wzm [Phycisphaerales bacterium]|nr:wzm [Phycisphaerales bacterium]MDB5354430.1 wzm [Phycisphaerales bacterium]